MIAYKVSRLPSDDRRPNIDDIVSCIENRMLHPRLLNVIGECTTSIEADNLVHAILGMCHRNTLLLIDIVPSRLSAKLLLDISQIRQIGAFYCYLHDDSLDLPFALQAPLWLYIKRGHTRVEMCLDVGSYEDICSTLARDAKLWDIGKLSSMEHSIQQIQLSRYLLEASWIEDLFSKKEIKFLNEQLLEEELNGELTTWIGNYRQKVIEKKTLAEFFYHYLMNSSNDISDYGFTKSSISFESDIPALHVSKLLVQDVQLDIPTRESILPIMVHQKSLSKKLSKTFMTDAVRNSEYEHCSSDDHDCNNKQMPSLKNTCLSKGFSSPWARGFLQAFNMRKQLPSEFLQEIIEDYILEKDLQKKEELGDQFEEVSSQVIHQRLMQVGLDLKTIAMLDYDTQDMVYHNFEQNGDLDVLIHHIQHKIKSYSSPSPDIDRPGKRKQFAWPFRLAPIIRSFEQIVQDDNPRNDARYNKLSEDMFNSLNQGRYFESALLSPQSPPNKREPESRNNRRGSVDLYDLKREPYIINCRPVLPLHQGSISDDDNMSMFSSISPHSKSKSRRTIDFPSQNLFDSEIVDFYNRYAEKIEEDIKCIIPAMVASLKTFTLPVMTSDREIQSIYQYKKQSSPYFLLLINFMHNHTVRDFMLANEGFMDCLVIDFGSGRDTLISRDKMKSAKSLFDSYCTAQMQYMSQVSEDMLVKQTQNLETLLVGSNMLMLGCFEVWINNGNDRELHENLGMIHMYYFGKRASPIMKINLIKTEEDEESKESDKDEIPEKVQNAEKNRELDQVMTLSPQQTTPAMLSFVNKASLDVLDEYSPARAVQTESSPENNFSSPVARDQAGFTAQKAKVLRPLLMDVI